CLAEESQFGVVRAQENGVAGIGCTAEILAVTKKYDDGRMDIVTEGRKRFEVLEMNQERDFLRANVLFFEDDTEQPTPEEVAQAVKLHRDTPALPRPQQALPTPPDTRLSSPPAGPLPPPSPS